MNKKNKRNNIRTQQHPKFLLQHLLQSIVEVPVTFNQCFLNRNRTIQGGKKHEFLNSKN